MKTTNKALFSSVIALILCCSMLIGSTFAWFTDEATSGVNQIIAGNLDVELYAGNAKVDSTTKLFDDITKWEPGAVAYENLTVANEGNLALKYELSVNFANAVAAPSGKTLADALQVGVVPGGVSGNRDAVLSAVTEWKSLKSFNLYGGLEALKDATYGIVIYWAPSANDNDFNMNNGQATVLSIDLGVHLYATQLENENDAFGKDYDEDAYAVDTSWYVASKTEYVLNSAAELRGLAAIVNGTASGIAIDGFAGKTIKLGADIDLRNADWTPIGDVEADDFVGFQGTFDGQDHTISNLKVTSDAWGQGLFGYTTSVVTVKNVKVHNANVTGSDNCGVIFGISYNTQSTFSDIHVTGSVSVVGTGTDGHVGGIVGNGYNATFENCSVVSAGGVITSAGSFAGGIVGYQCNNAKTIKNCAVEGLTISGYGAIGGIAGIVQTGSAAIDNCSVKNVVLNKTRADGNPSIGALIGCYSGTAATPLTGKVENVTLNGTHVAYSAYNVLYGSNYSGATTPSFDVSGVIGAETITNNLVEIVAISDAAGLKAALENGGDNYVLTKDIVVSKNETIEMNHGVAATIDLNGHTISGTADKSGNQELFLIKGDLTVKNGALSYTASNNQGWNAMITIFDVTAGGELTLDHVQAVVSGSDMNFIVHLNNWGSATLNVNNCDFSTTYVAVRAFNSGYDMNNVTIENTAVHGGRFFWVHNYTSEGAGDATLNLNIFGNGNTCDHATPVRKGFSNALYFAMDGTEITG